MYNIFSICKAFELGFENGVIMDMDKKVVITGYGIVSPLGKNKLENAENLFPGKSGIVEHQFEYLDGKVKAMSGVLKKDIGIHTFFDKYCIKYDRASNLALYASDECIAESGIGDFDLDGEEVGVVVGTSLGGMLSADIFHTTWIEKGIDKADGEYLRQYPLHAVADILAKNFKFCGPKSIISTACSSGANAVGLAADLVKDGLCQAVLVGGVDPISRFSFAGFSALKAIELERCKPYSGSTGINIGEGAAFFLVESYEHATKRKAKIIADIKGYGLSADAYHPTAPDLSGNGAVRSMNMALKEAGYTINDISYINGHGTGTPANDQAETKAWKAFCQEDKKVPLISNKASVGHCMGAAGAVEIAFSLLSIEKGMIPPTINFKEQSMEIDFVPNKAREEKIKAVLSNSFAFGGNNCSVIISEHDSSTKKEIERNVDDIVITGMGCLGVGGANIEELFQTFEEGIDCIKELDITDKDYHAKYIGNFPNISYKNHIPSAVLRRIDNVTKLAMVSGRQALASSGLTVTPSTSHRIGVIYGTGTGPLETIEAVSRNMIVHGIQGVNANLFPNTVLNAAPGHFSIRNMLKGVTSTISAGSISGLEAFIYAVILLKQNKADAIVVLSSDEWNETLQVGYEKLNLLSQNGAKPFSKNATGVILSQGSTAFVLERKKHAIERSANILAQVHGYSLSSDNPDLNGFGDERAWCKCMHDAVKMSGNKKIDYYASTAYGIPRVDRNELKLIKSVFDNKTTVRSIPSLIGAASGSVGTFGLLSCLFALTKNKIPKENACQADYIEGVRELLERKVEGEIQYAAVGVTSFGGSHASVIIGKEHE